MAQRRMFSPDIVESPEFLAMPASTQLLYFHLGMHADDDGFVYPEHVARTIGMSGDDNMKILLAKRFVLPFESGVVVIKHWLIHNMIRADRYKPTRYQDEKKSLYIKENKAYTDRLPVGLQNGNQMAPQDRIGQDRLIGTSKDVRIEKDPENEKEPRSRAVKPAAHKAVFYLWGKYPKNWETNKTQIRAANNLLSEKGLGKVQKALAFYLENKDEMYCPSITSPHDLDTKWSKLFAFKTKNGL